MKKKGHWTVLMTKTHDHQTKKEEHSFIKKQKSTLSTLLCHFSFVAKIVVAVVSVTKVTISIFKQKHRDSLPSSFEPWYDPLSLSDMML